MPYADRNASAAAAAAKVIASAAVGGDYSRAGERARHKQIN